MRGRDRCRAALPRRCSAELGWARQQLRGPCQLKDRALTGSLPGRALPGASHALPHCVPHPTCCSLPIPSWPPVPAEPRGSPSAPCRGGREAVGEAVSGGARGLGCATAPVANAELAVPRGRAGGATGGGAGGRAELRACGAGGRGCECRCCPRPPAAAPPSRPAAEPHSRPSAGRSAGERQEGVAGEREEEQRRSRQPAVPRSTPAAGPRFRTRLRRPAGGASRGRGAERSGVRGGHGGPAAGAAGARAAAAAAAAPGKERRPPPRPCPAGVQVPSLPGRARERFREGGAVKADPFPLPSGAFGREAPFLRAPREDGGLRRVGKRRGGAGPPSPAAPCPRPGRGHPAPARRAPCGGRGDSLPHVAFINSDAIRPVENGRGGGGGVRRVASHLRVGSAAGCGSPSPPLPSPSLTPRIMAIAE